MAIVNTKYIITIYTQFQNKNNKVKKYFAFKIFL